MIRRPSFDTRSYDGYDPEDTGTGRESPKQSDSQVQVHTEHELEVDYDSEEDENDSSLATRMIPHVEFSGVDFGRSSTTSSSSAPTMDAHAHAQRRLRLLLEFEQSLAFPDLFLEAFQQNPQKYTASSSSLSSTLDHCAHLLATGQYAALLASPAAMEVLRRMEEEEETAKVPKGDDNETTTTITEPSMVVIPQTQSVGVGSIAFRIRHAISLVLHYPIHEPTLSSEEPESRTLVVIETAILLEMMGIASLCLFLQANYTGPALQEEDPDDTLRSINPHACFRQPLHSDVVDNENNDPRPKTATCTSSSANTTSSSFSFSTSSAYQNAVLSELAVQGIWPCQVCRVPYFLLLARSIFTALVEIVEGKSSRLTAAPLWCARSAVAHERLLRQTISSTTSTSINPLWKEVQRLYQSSLEMLQQQQQEPSHSSATAEKAAAAAAARAVVARVHLEYGLAQHHFRHVGMGRSCFVAAQQASGLLVHVTGATGKRTKYQTKATPQMLVKATSASTLASKYKPVMVSDEGDRDENKCEQRVREQMIEHSEDGILLERIQFEDDKENEISALHIFDQTILLALCLDVKNSNPVDGLTAEEMGSYLACVLDYHDDWMIYSTALLERAWLEFERSHVRERAILQMQALVDQYTERLTLTQSTRKSIEDSAPVQDRLKMLHYLVYPPRWELMGDLGDRYAALGIVSTAAELFVQVEMWDEVVSCYRRAGNVAAAEAITRERLAIMETPRMWTALGDLTNEPDHYRKAIELSKGRFSDAYVSLGAYYFDRNDLESALVQYESAVKVRPLLTHIWFRIGTIAMQLDQWTLALRAFSEVVQQEPEESEAWANIAAIHMRNKQPSLAYPALVESLKQNRNNWRVWISKLYTCLDLEKFDEAIQACTVLLDLRASSDRIPPLEARCVRAIVGGALSKFKENQGDEASSMSSRRTLSRAYQLINRLSSSSDVEPWVYETMAYFHEQVGRNENVLNDLMKEYRSLQAVVLWEKDILQIRKICSVVSHIVDIHVQEGSRESLTKAKWLVLGIINKVNASQPDTSTLPEEALSLKSQLLSIKEKLLELQL